MIDIIKELMKWLNKNLKNFNLSNRIYLTGYIITKLKINNIKLKMQVSIRAVSILILYPKLRMIKCNMDINNTVKACAAKPTVWLLKLIRINF